MFYRNVRELLSEFTVSHIPEEGTLHSNAAFRNAYFLFGCFGSLLDHLVGFMKQPEVTLPANLETSRSP
jgi:hypothetical protein